jgi:putative restriction endonuclease
MRGLVANTDFEWFRSLAARPDIEEINFWQPSGGLRFRSLPPGEPRFFRL